MKWLLAFFITFGLWAAFYVVSVFAAVDVMWILVLFASIWAAIDSKKIGLYKYKSSIRTRPVVLFCCMYLLWIFIFPIYLWARWKIKAGELDLKENSLEGLGPMRRFFRRFAFFNEQILGWILIVLVALKICLLVFFMEESWRGSRAWAQFKKQKEANGETFAWEALIPPPVPDAQNFYSAPHMTEWFVKPSQKVFIGDNFISQIDSNWPAAEPQTLLAELTVKSAGLKPFPSNAIVNLDDYDSRQKISRLLETNWGKNVIGIKGGIIFLSNLPANQKKPLRIFLETNRKINTTNLLFYFNNQVNLSGPIFVRPDDTNSFQVLTTFFAASNYLKQTARFEKNFSLIREAVQRPYAQPAGNYSYPIDMPIPNYVAFRGVCQTLAQRAQCYLLMEQPENAVRELTLLNDLRKKLEGAPTGKPMTLVSAMINVAIANLISETITDGFRLHAWKADQLKKLEQQLQSIDLIPFLHESMRSEQISIERYMREAWKRFEVNPQMTFLEKLKHFEPLNFMKGYYYFNILNAVELDEKALQAIDLNKRVIQPKKLADLQKELDANNKIIFPFTIYKLMAAIAVPNFGRAFQTAAQSQTKVDQLQIVCALERYHLVHNDYPENLEQLKPDFIQELPHDVIGGQPLKYHHVNLEEFKLYSIGWNETDEAGKRGQSLLEGDWSWN